MIYTIYGKEGCVFCDKAKQLLDKIPQVQYIYVDVYEVGEAMRLMVEKGYKTVPQIYVTRRGEESKYVGGYSELAEEIQNLYGVVL